MTTHTKAAGNTATFRGARAWRAVAGIITAFGLSLAATAAAAGDFRSAPAIDPLYPNPPFLQTNVDEYMVTVWEADRAAIAAMLPPGIEPAATNTVGMSHYVVREGAGLAPFEATYVFAEVEGFDDPGGGKGRWFLWGLYSPDRAVTALREVFGFGPRLGTTKVAETGKRLRGAGSWNGKEVLASEVVAKADPPVSVGGVLHYPGMRNVPTVLGATASSELLLHRIAWTAKVQMADPVSVKIDLPDGHPLRKLAPKKLLYAYYGKDVNWVFGHIQVIEGR
jgi:hypothetical protein